MIKRKTRKQKEREKSLSQTIDWLAHKVMFIYNRKRKTFSLSRFLFVFRFGLYHCLVIFCSSNDFLRDNGLVCFLAQSNCFSKDRRYKCVLAHATSSIELIEQQDQLDLSSSFFLFPI